jgi:hypothetical protein
LGGNSGAAKPALIRGRDYRSSNDGVGVLVIVAGPGTRVDVAPRADFNSGVKIADRLSVNDIQQHELDLGYWLMPGEGGVLRAVQRLG